MGPDLFGTWSYFYSYFSILLLFSYFGVRASTKFLAEYNGTEYLGEIINKVVQLRILASTLFAIFAFAIAEPLAELIKRPEFTPYFRWSSLMIFFLSFTEFLKGAFQGLHRIRYNFVVNCLEHGTKLLLVAVALYCGAGFIGIIQAIAIAGAIATVFCTFLLYSNFFVKGKSFGEEPIMTRIIKYSIPLMMISIGFLIATEIDTLMLGMLTTDKEVGLYSIAKQLITKLPHISMAIAMGSMPIFAKMNKDNVKKLRQHFRRLLMVNAGLFGFIILAILLTSPFFIPLIYGADYAAAVLPLRILCAYLLCATFLSYFNSFLDYRGLAKRRMYNLFFSTLVNIGLNYALIPKYGATGAAIATSISYFPYLMLNIWETRQSFKQAELALD